MEVSLAQEKEHHQQELTSLQLAHQQNMQAMSRRHELEIGQLQEQIDALQGKLQSSQSTSADLKTQELEELNSSKCISVYTLYTLGFQVLEINNSKWEWLKVM